MLARLQYENIRIGSKNYYLEGPYVVFGAECLWNDWVKKDKVNANVI